MGNLCILGLACFLLGYGATATRSDSDWQQPSEWTDFTTHTYSDPNRILHYYEEHLPGYGDNYIYTPPKQ